MAQHTLNRPIINQQLVRFAVVGALGTLIDFMGLVALKQLWGVSTGWANMLSFGAGIINNFVWNRLWTFPEARRSRVWRQFVQFSAVSVIGAVLNTALVVLLEHPLGVLLHAPDYGYVPAKLIATVVVFFWNFYANRLWTFGTGNEVQA